MESALTSKGQATIPKAIRDHLGLKSGDRIKFFMHPAASFFCRSFLSRLCAASSGLSISR
jgi:AbrB family looped-hinge helix DNA binding protein